ncbi:MAG: response regulator transcription factor [Thermacetogeniaceae bacterium]|jgi:DNA-binding response OmpR family regulator
MRMLLVEDEVRLAEALSYIFKKNGYGVDVANDGITGQDMAETGIYDLIILDRMLPGKEGLQILKELRKSKVVTPVLILTAKDAVGDRVEGLDCGADDYLIKPFATEELLARIRALQRRQSEVLQSECIKTSTLSFNPLSGEVESGGESVRLTLKEAQLLELLLRNRKQVITREQIFDKVWGLDSDIEINTIEVHLSYLRKKLNGLNCGISIEAVRGIGYCLKEG